MVIADNSWNDYLFFFLDESKNQHKKDALYSGEQIEYAAGLYT